ncbi:MAG: hypothetical protein HKN33_08350 [Pyrinomonadaceae bacterium]|nr:hypothetical protein [Pyrinomonadaceae bacterium]
MPRSYKYKLSVWSLLKLCVLLFTFIGTAPAFPGDLDISFGTGGKVTTPIGTASSDVALISALQPDGKTILAGYTNTGSNLVPVVIRIDEDGSLDTTFGLNGVASKRISGPTVPLSAETYAFITSIAIQPDGKIVVAGFYTLVTIGNLGAGNIDFFLRLNPDGSFDESFGGDGMVAEGGAGLPNVWGIALQPDGKIVAVGDYQFFRSGAFRLNTDGTIDESFGGGSIPRVDLFTGGTTRIYDVLIQPDGKIVAGGFNEGGFTIARMNPDGSFDHRFGKDGKIITPTGTPNGRAYSIALQSDGKIVAAGNSSGNSGNQMVIARYGSDGTIDTSFDGDGIVTTTVGSFDTRVRSVIAQTDGKIVVGGYTADSAEDDDLLLIRIESDGSFDPTFGTDGVVRTDASGSEDIGRSLTLRPDGKIALAGFISGTTEPELLVSQYQTNGSPDTAFGSNGISRLDLANSSDEATAVAVQADGKIVTGGVAYCCKRDFRLARYDQAGNLDPSFGVGGIVEPSIGTEPNKLTGLRIQPDGKIVAVGYSQSSANDYGVVLARFNSDGTSDLSFGVDGVVLSNRASGDALAIQADGKLVVGGWTSTNTRNTRRFMVLRFNPDGSVDSTFGLNGETITTIFEENIAQRQRVTDIEIQQDGKIVVAGTVYVGIGFSTVPWYMVTLRYESDGYLDRKFGNDGFVTSNFQHGGASDLEIQADGKIVIVNGYEAIFGNFATYRYNPDGSPDLAFGVAGVAESAIGDGAAAGGITIQPNGKILVGGSAIFGNDLDFAVVRYNPNGSPDIGFGSGGVVSTDFAGDYDRINNIALTAEGKIFAAGYSNNGLNRDFALAAYLSDPAVSTAVPYDFDGDGRSDISVFRPAEGNWYLFQSTQGFTAINWGIASDTLVPGDYDGDGRADTAIFRPSDTGGVPDFYVLNSDGFVLSGVEWGVPGDQAVVDDYDGDGRDDFAVYRPGTSTWYVLRSSGGISVTTFGGPGDTPVTGDFDGDGKADPTTFNAGVWTSTLSGGGTETVTNGAAGDVLVPGDYDGDGQTDQAAFRDGSWYLWLSSLGSQQVVPFGSAGDIPAPGDFDGDGKFDLSIYRDGQWWISNSGNGAVTTTAFGVPTDVPVPGN